MARTIERAPRPRNLPPTLPGPADVWAFVHVVERSPEATAYTYHCPFCRDAHTLTYSLASGGVSPIQATACLKGRVFLIVPAGTPIRHLAPVR